jgi:hypothetical protein
MSGQAPPDSPYIDNAKLMARTPERFQRSLQALAAGRFEFFIFAGGGLHTNGPVKGAVEDFALLGVTRGRFFWGHIHAVGFKAGTPGIFKGTETINFFSGNPETETTKTTLTEFDFGKRGFGFYDPEQGHPGGYGFVGIGRLGFFGIGGASWPD